jgi:hypothetical protein
MPRVGQSKKSKAGVDIGCDKHGKPIQVGETYYHWKFLYGPKKRRATWRAVTQKGSELTQSKMSGVYAAPYSSKQPCTSKTLTGNFAGALVTISLPTML